MTVTQKRYSIPGVTGNSYEFASPATAVPVIGVLQPFAYAVQLPLVKLQLERAQEEIVLLKEKIAILEDQLDKLKALNYIQEKYNK